MTSPSPTSSSKKEAPRPGRWRDHIEAATMAIVVAVMLKYFVVEAYQIPSGSMQPTLMGSPEAGIFDRILVDKLSFHFRDPERFEVCVFKYPLDRSKSFIKRLVGMPGEDLRVQFGDLWTRADASQPWSILRRPLPVQEAVWKRLDTEDPRYASWRPEGGARAWTIHGRAGFEAHGAGSVRLPAQGDSIRDSYFDGYPGKMAQALKQSERIRRYVPSGIDDVGDVRVAGEITAESSLRTFSIELHEGERLYRFTLPGPAAPADFEPWKVTVPEGTKAYPDQPDARVVRYDPPGGEAAQAGHPFAWRLPAGRKISFAAQNMDDLLRLEVDGQCVYEIEVPASAEQRSFVSLAVDGDAAVSDTEVYRDIYYTQGRDMLSEFHIPPGKYVMMGDNTQDSSDSREWKFARWRWDGAGSEGDWVRGNLRGNNENPTFVQENGRRRVFFRDEWGELHTFLESVANQGQEEVAPYVPRELITGRAVLVFWPFSVGLGVYRMKWIR